MFIFICIDPSLVLSTNSYNIQTCSLSTFTLIYFSSDSHTLLRKCPKTNSNNRLQFMLQNKPRTVFTYTHYLKNTSKSKLVLSKSPTTSTNNRQYQRIIENMFYSSRNCSQTFVENVAKFEPNRIFNQLATNTTYTVQTTN